MLKELLTKRYQSIGNSIAHAAFVEDAVIMGDNGQLGEIINNLQQDESELTLIHFTDDKNRVIASSDTNSVGKLYKTNNIESGASLVKEQEGIYMGGFSINIGSKKVGALYFDAKPSITSTSSSTPPNSMLLVVGIAVAFFVFLIIILSNRSIEKRVLVTLNKREAKTYTPKIEALKNELLKNEKELEEIHRKISEMGNDYEKKKKEMETDPVFQSVEKLKATETELLKRLEVLKDQESRLDKEVELLTQKREEIRSALEAEKKEESILHEKLALIKKKILRLETPEK